MIRFWYFLRATYPLSVDCSRMAACSRRFSSARSSRAAFVCSRKLAFWFWANILLCSRLKVFCWWCIVVDESVCFRRDCGRSGMYLSFQSLPRAERYPRALIQSLAGYFLHRISSEMQNENILILFQLVVQCHRLRLLSNNHRNRPKRGDHFCWKFSS